VRELGNIRRVLKFSQSPPQRVFSLTLVDIGEFTQEPKGVFAISGGSYFFAINFGS
jgi:hypothetical protein